MWLSYEDARSDFVLAVATAVLGRFAISLIVRIPGYPLTGFGFEILNILWIVAVTGLVPFLLARYRRDVPGAFGFAPADRGPIVPGLVVMAPLVVAHLLPIVLTGDLTSMGYGLLGRLGGVGPTIARVRFDVDWVIFAVTVAALAVGAWLFLSFVVVRARDAFRSPDLDVTEGLRTYGMGTVGATLILGLLRALTPDLTFGDALLSTAALLAVLLVVDQYVPARLTTTRATLLAPAISVAIMAVLAAGGIFRGDLLAGLHEGAQAAVITLCVAALIEAKQGWTAVFLIGAAAVYSIPTLPLDLFLPVY